MRLKENMRNFFACYVKEYFPDAKVYLFGSRIDDNAKGGDIDILVISNEKLSFIDISKMRIHFYKKFGEQKVDILNFAYSEEDPFKNIVLNHAIEL
jgi:predicted nucleotidyltransferase